MCYLHPYFVLRYMDKPYSPVQYPHWDLSHLTYFLHNKHHHSFTTTIWADWHIFLVQIGKIKGIPRYWNCLSLYRVIVQDDALQPDLCLVNKQLRQSKNWLFVKTKGEAIHILIKLSHVISIQHSLLRFLPYMQYGENRLNKMCLLIFHFWLQYQMGGYLVSLHFFYVICYLFICVHL